MPRYLLWLVASNNYVDTQGWNFFFGSEAAASPFLFIDMQWTGRGHPLQVRTREQNNRTTILSCQDVAYALTTTLEEESLPKMDSLVHFYLDRLGQKLAGKKINLDIAEMRKEYDKVIFRMTRQYRIQININYYQMQQTYCRQYLARLLTKNC